MIPHKNAKPFHSAKTEVEKIVAKTKKARKDIPAYRLAFLDQDFLLRKALRPVRLQLELLKPELVQQDENVKSTAVIFGSARILEPKLAKKQLTEAKRALKIAPNNTKRLFKVAAAKQAVEYSRYYNEAQKLAYLISCACQKNKRRHLVVVTGGGLGIMEAANRGAHDANAKSIGYTIVLPSEDEPNPYISPQLCFQFHYFAIRKMHFLIRAQAAIFFPGGFGTLDELFETLTLLQTRKIKPMPIILIGEDYWLNIINFKGLVATNMISAEDISLFQFAETAEETWQIIKNFYKVAKKKRSK